MYGLRTETQHCPDGVTLGKDGIFRPRTATRHKLRLETVTLRTPYVLAFVNATDDEKLAEFLSRNGFLDSGMEGRAKEIHKHRAALTHLLELAGSEDPRRVAEVINKLSKALGGWLKEVKALLETETPDRLADLSSRIIGMGAPTTLSAVYDRGVVFLRCDDLAAHMQAEIRFVADRGTQFSRCAQCQKGLLTGASTGRKSNAQYCSGRCRAAAVRARQAEEKS